MRIAAPKKTARDQRWVAFVPESCKKLIQAGYDTSIEAEGVAAGLPPPRTAISG
jgi:NAD/NADP transhydrogenase alpha subunit